jgi:hypothetical protein
LRLQLSLNSGRKQNLNYQDFSFLGCYTASFNAWLEESNYEDGGRRFLRNMVIYTELHGVILQMILLFTPNLKVT